MEEIRPQEGPQEDFSASSADIVIYGGAAYGGKSFGLLLESTRHIKNPRYNGVIFRRESPQITSGGGLWDTASQIYPHLGGQAKEHKLTYIFPSNAYIKFTHLQHESDKLNHQGAQYVFIGFDELTHFTEGQFWYLLTRNRPPNGCNIRAYCRCTTNPESESWVRDLISWWIDEETGYAIPERSGVVRYFTRIDDDILWVDKDWTDEEGNMPRSLTFIPSKIEDNPKGIEADPMYKSNLQAQDKVTRERLLKGNWNINYKGGMFNPEWFKIVDNCPSGVKWVRYWDRAATAPKDEDDDPDWNAGAKVGIYNGDLVIADMKRFRETPAVNEEKVQSTAREDGYDVDIGYEIEPGSAGVEVANHYQTEVLKGYSVFLDRPTGSKVERCRPWCALAEQGHVILVKGKWNRAFLAEAGSFPYNKKDQIDAVSGGYKLLTQTDVVFPYHNHNNRKKFKMDWKKVDPRKCQVFGMLYQGKDHSISGNFFFWNREYRTLRVYAELNHPNPIADTLALDIIRQSELALKATTPFQIAVDTIYGNDNMFAKGKDDVVWKLHKAGVRVKENVAYNEAASVLQANRMFRNNQIIVNSSLEETDRQYRTWTIENQQPVKGYPLCRSLCHIINVLRDMGAFKEEVEMKPYGKRKTAIRKHLKAQSNQDGVKFVPKTKRSFDDYLAL